MQGSKCDQNGSFDLRTSCPKISCNPLPSFHSCTPSSKYLFYLVLWGLSVKSICVFDGIWQYNVKIRKFKFLWSAVMLSLYWKADTTGLWRSSKHQWNNTTAYTKLQIINESLMHERLTGFGCVYVAIKNNRTNKFSKKMFMEWTKLFFSELFTNCSGFAFRFSYKIKTLCGKLIPRLLQSRAFSWVCLVILETGHVLWVFSRVEIFFDR